MKSILSIMALSLTLALAAPSFAAEGLTEKMNSLFPTKQADPEKNITPAKPELSAPDFFSKIKGDKATLNWNAVTGADKYHVQVSTDSNFKWLVANEAGVTGTNYEISGLQAGKHYFWRVAAVKSDNWSTFTKGPFASSMFETPVK